MKETTELLGFYRFFANSSPQNMFPQRQGFLTKYGLKFALQITLINCDLVLTVNLYYFTSKDQRDVVLCKIELYDRL